MLGYQFLATIPSSVSGKTWNRLKRLSYPSLLSLVSQNQQLPATWLLLFSVPAQKAYKKKNVLSDLSKSCHKRTVILCFLCLLKTYNGYYHGCFGLLRSLKRPWDSLCFFPNLNFSRLHHITVSFLCACSKGVGSPISSNCFSQNLFTSGVDPSLQYHHFWQFSKPQTTERISLFAFSIFSEFLTPLVWLPPFSVSG